MTDEIDVDLSKVISTRELYALRKSANMTQTEMAKELGMTVRGYQKLESGESPIKPIHGKAVQFVLIERMAAGNVPEDAQVRELVKAARTRLEYHEGIFG